MNPNYYIMHPSSCILKWHKILVCILIYLVIPFTPVVRAEMAAIPQEAKVHQNKIDKERAKKAKEGQKQYEKAVKKHMDNQSKETKKMMKQAKKDAKKNNPLK